MDEMRSRHTEDIEVRSGTTLGRKGPYSVERTGMAGVQGNLNSSRREERPS